MRGVQSRLRLLKKRHRVAHAVAGVVIGHHTEGRDVDKENRSQAKHIILDLLPSMFEAAPGEFIHAAKGSLSNTA